MLQIGWFCSSSKKYEKSLTTQVIKKQINIRCDVFYEVIMYLFYFYIGTACEGDFKKKKKKK